jgi:hypothetical protein
VYGDWYVIDYCLTHLLADKLFHREECNTECSGFPNNMSRKFSTFAQALAFVNGPNWRNMRPWLFQPGPKGW